MKTIKTLFALAALAASGAAFAHGETVDPPARQVTCNLAQDYWYPPDGSNIKNAACRAAFDESGTVPFVQINQFAANVADYNNQNAVRKTVKDGTLCAGGNSDFAGMDIPSDAWAKTPVHGGKYTLRFLSTATHNPSFWEIYLSKPYYNAGATKLKWSDLILINKIGNILPKQGTDGQTYYTMQIDLPQNRQGTAVLYTRWQRNDPAGEGFYNCSDVTFTAPAANLRDQGALLKPGFKARAGDTVWFRVFDKTGKELIFEKLPIDADNADLGKWLPTLAEQVRQHGMASTVRIGVQQGKDIVMQGTGANNRVWLGPNARAFALDVRTPSTLPQ